MLKQTTILIFLFLGILTSAAWALTSHVDYAKMEIKECTACHQSNGVPPNHGSMWSKDHRLFAEKMPNNCKDCHQQSFCLDCHTGGGIDRDLHVSNSGVDYMPMSHRTDFKEIHPIKALDDPQSCYRCHDEKRFCNECHSKFNQNDLMVLSHQKGYSNIEVSAGGPLHSTFTAAQCQTCHPNGMLSKHAWSDAHAREARQKLASCQSCHPDGDVCLKCHSAVTGLKVNPHPREWSKISGKLGKASNNRTCVKCH